MWQEIRPVPPPSTRSRHCLLSLPATLLPSRGFSERKPTRGSCVSRRGQAPWEQETWPSCLPWRRQGFHQNVLLRVHQSLSIKFLPCHCPIILPWFPMTPSLCEHPKQAAPHVSPFLQRMHTTHHCHPHNQAHPDITVPLLTPPPEGHSILQCHPASTSWHRATPQLCPDVCLSQTIHAMKSLSTQGT